ncbi:MAG TPA: thiamine pyrophosphate-dependent enzyme [Dehalococcoidales bacterium]|nr:MAG: pyruvate ferredoxin oxidoreductase [Chloroflexi bacterium RBG_16_60_22]HJX12758.1 thiamine pyrophosphate-dependent enzyme [Dehalococcoidales bacterium]
MEKYAVYVPRLVKKKDNFAPGHRACIGCGEALAVRMAFKAVGNNVIAVSATGCMEIVASQLPFTSWHLPWIHTLFENTAAVASGIEAGYKAMKRKGVPLPDNTKVIAYGGDGATSDIGLQALSGAMERGHDFTYICFDNEAYMNTGIQRSSATPFGAATTTSPAGKKSTGQFSWKKNMPAIAVAHDIPYVATATHGYPFDLMEKVRKAVATPGLSYVHVLSVCPTGWRSATDTVNRQARLAVQTGMFPLYEVENGVYKMSLDLPGLRPVKDYLKMQGRFRHLSDELIAQIQARVELEYNKILEKAKDGSKRAKSKGR